LNSIKKALKINSIHTIEKYLRYIDEAFIIFRIEKFSSKSKERIYSKSKIYVIDNGIINTYSFRLSENMGKLMENTVAIELLRQSKSFSEFDVKYWRDEKQGEVDFVIKMGMRIKQLVQVTYTNSKDSVKGGKLKIFCMPQMNWDATIY
jgi:hypothetical protein